MLSLFAEFQEQLNNATIEFPGKIQRDFFKKITFFSATKGLSENEIRVLEKNVKKSSTIFINSAKNEAFIITFKNTVIFVESYCLRFLHKLFSFNCNIKLFFINQQAKDSFDNNIRLQYQEVSNIIHQDEIYSFRENLRDYFRLSRRSKQLSPIWKIIDPCILGNEIMEAYNKLGKNRIKKFIKNDESKIIKIDQNEFIYLRDIAVGSSHRIQLIYHIEKRELFTIKISYYDNHEKLFDRELNNYKALSHPFMPKLLGKSDQGLIIEYINGKTLESIQKLKLDDNDKITIIFELMIIIEFIHRNKFILRDLKPSDIIIDENMNVVLVDFDRMISYREIIENEEHTYDFCSDYCSPDIWSGLPITYKCDIYSLGMIIYLIMNEKRPPCNIEENTLTCNNHEMNEIIKICTKRSPDERPSILELIEKFYNQFHSQIKFDVCKILDIYKSYFSDIYDINKIDYIQQQILGKDNENKKLYNGEYEFKIGQKYEENEKQDINKAIYYFTLAANFNHPKAQIKLGLFYLKQNSINKAINYLAFAAKQNDAEAQFNLGLIYYEDKYGIKDFEKSIHYFSLSAENNCVQSQMILAKIYSENQIVKQDIQKAIYYYSKASNQNDAEAQFNLGLIYYEDKYGIKDFEKSIHYFSLSAENNCVQSQMILAKIYFEDRIVKQDIQNVIYYYSKASELQNPEAQFNLGLIYYEDKYGNKNVMKSIHYFSLSAEQNYVQSQLILAKIYFEGKIVTRDINKAYRYFSLAAKQNHQNAILYLNFIQSN